MCVYVYLYVLRGKSLIMGVEFNKLALFVSFIYQNKCIFCAVYVIKMFLTFRKDMG
jgi:hypothetical protein